MVLLEPPADAPALVVQGGTCRSPRKPPANGMGRYVIPPVGGSDRRVYHPCVSVHYTHSRCRIGASASGYDDYGYHQPHGMGAVSKIHG
jgi:hypothetical protein